MSRNSPEVEPFIPPSPSSFTPKEEAPRLPTPDLQSSPSQPYFSPDPVWNNPFRWPTWYYNPAQRAIQGHLPTDIPVIPSMQHIPQDIPTTTSLRLHYHLCFNPINPAVPHIGWDVIFPPSHARIADFQISGPTRFTPLDVDTEALKPSVKRVWVSTDHQSLAYWMGKWGPISITGDKITVADILQAIYDYLRIPLTREDMQQVSMIPGNRECLRMARAFRARDSLEVEAVVLAAPYRRVDMVGGHRRFQGMKIVVMPDQTWRLYFGLIAGTLPRHR